MDSKIWEKSIVAWVNSLEIPTPIRNANEINDFILMEIIKKFKSDFQQTPFEFLKCIYPKLFECDSFVFSSTEDYLCAATLLLIYVSFSKTHELEELREIMCTKLDNATQVNITEFLKSMQEYDVFKCSYKIIQQEIHNFVEKHSPEVSFGGDSTQTPMKNNVSNCSFDSPLQGFFQTPKRSHSNKRIICSGMCGDGDSSKLMKKLTNQLVEEELEKATLQEQLNICSQKCNDYEIKLRNKIDEINHLKYEWENESKKNETEFTSLKNNFMKKLEDEKKLKNELTILENYVSTLESDFSSSANEKDELKNKVQSLLEKYAQSEFDLREATEQIRQLQAALEIKEQELIELKNEFALRYKDENAIDNTFMNNSLDRSVHPPENLGVVLDKLLAEKTDLIENLRQEKDDILNELKSMHEQVKIKESTILELQFLNNELSCKMEKFDSTEQKLFNIQKELSGANAEIKKLLNENSLLSEKCSAQDKALINCKNSKRSLHINFLKLAKDFKDAQQRLELEIKNISRLTLAAEKRLLPENVSNVVGINAAKNVLVPNLKPEEFVDAKLEKIAELIQNFESTHVEWSESKILMQKTCEQLNQNIVDLKIKISELEENQKKLVAEKIQIELQLKEAEEKMTVLNSSHFTEIEKLKSELRIKESIIENLEVQISQSKKIQSDLSNENDIIKKNKVKVPEKNLIKFSQDRGDFNETCDFGCATEFSRTQKIVELTKKEQELSDSLEEIPVCSKTFDIVNLDEKEINETTFSVKKENADIDKKNIKYTSSWVVSPPSKNTPKSPPKQSAPNHEKKKTKGETWIVSFDQNNSSENKPKKVLLSGGNLVSKYEPHDIENNVNLTKSSSLSSIIEVDSSVPSRIGSKTSTASLFYSVTDLISAKTKEKVEEISQDNKVEQFQQVNTALKVQSSKNSNNRKFTLVERTEDPLAEIFNRDFRDDDSSKYVLEEQISALRKEIIEFSKECEHLKSSLVESEHKRKKDKEMYEKNQDIIRQNITAKYESQLELLKNEMKLLHNQELAKHKAEQSKLTFELREQNKRYKEHIDELRNQLWDLGEKLLQEQKLKRDLERNFKELKEKFKTFIFTRDSDTKSLQDSEIYHKKEPLIDENNRLSSLRHIKNGAFPTIPTEDEDEIFDNRFLEDMKSGVCKVEKPEGRLLELQYRNSLCLPHLKSSYPGETQFHNPTLFRENDLKLGLLQFGQESQSLTDSDHSMTKSLLPDTKGKKKEQTSYKKPGPPTPSKNGGRLSIQSCDLKITPRNILKESNDFIERTKGTPNPLKGLLLSKSNKNGKDENTAPVTPRKKNKFFRKPFGARDH